MAPIPSVREPEDIFRKEFYRHPGWEPVLLHLQQVALDLKLLAASASPDQFPQAKGRYEGAYEMISVLRTMLKAE